MAHTLEDYRERVAGTNIDPRSLLCTDYFNSFNSVIMLFGMLPDMPDLLEEIDAWSFLDYAAHFEASGLDFATLAIEAYGFSPPPLRAAFERKIQEMSSYVEESRTRLHELLDTNQTDLFGETAIQASRKLQEMADAGSAIVHGYDLTLDQDAIDKLF